MVNRGHVALLIALFCVYLGAHVLVAVFERTAGVLP